MRWKMVASAAGLALAGCENAAAAPPIPDSNNAAHCYAAFNLGNFVFVKGDLFAEALADGQARMEFEKRRPRSAGTTEDDFYAEAIAVTRPHRLDPKPLFAILEKCMIKQHANPAFRKQYPALLSEARANPYIRR